MPHPQQSPKRTKVQFYPSSPWGTNEFTRLSHRAWMRGCCQGCCGPKAATLEYLHSATGGDSPVATDGVPLLIVSPAYLFYPHPRPQRPPAAKANGWESAGCSGGRPMTPKAPLLWENANSQQAQLWGAHTARLMMVTLLCWGLGRIAPYSSTLSISLMRASWTKNRTQGEEKRLRNFPQPTTKSRMKRIPWELRA